MSELDWILLATAAVVEILGIVWLLDRRQMRIQRRRDLTFALHVADAMARGARRRPKVDNRIQRRRYAR